MHAQPNGALRFFSFLRAIQMAMFVVNKQTAKASKIHIFVISVVAPEESLSLLRTTRNRHKSKKEKHEHIIQIMIIPVAHFGFE